MKSKQIVKAAILVVEDTPANMTLATLILEKAGYAVLQACNAADGIALARSAAPDLILMDIQLPGMSGLEAARTLKGDPATRAIPIIAMTAFAMKGDEEKMLAAGCDGYLAKPIHYKELAAAADAKLGRHEGNVGREKGNDRRNAPSAK